MGNYKEYELVKSVISIFNMKQPTGIVKDITKKKLIDQGIADIVVSTNTFHWIKSSKKQNILTEKLTLKKIVLMILKKINLKLKCSN